MHMDVFFAPSDDEETPKIQLDYTSLIDQHESHSSATCSDDSLCVDVKNLSRIDLFHVREWTSQRD